MLVDGNQLPVLEVTAEPVIGGDARIAAIAAASILAKVHRDRLCEGLHVEYPSYGFADHKGYATASHLSALKLHGAVPAPPPQFCARGGADRRAGFMSRVRLIGSRSNPQWQQLRRLAQQPSAYRQQRRVWLEGEHLCSEAARRGESIELSVIGESAWSESPLRALAEAAPEVLVLPDALLGALSTMDSAPPLAMVLPWPGELAMDPGAPSVVLDRLQDAGNVGTIIRSAAAFGFEQVLALKGCAALWSPKVMRAGMGAHFALRLIESMEPDDLAVLEVPLLATSSHAVQGGRCDGAAVAVCLGPGPRGAGAVE